MKHIAKILLLVILLAALLGCNNQAQNPTKIRLMLDWTPSSNHTGIYLAQALGYYREAGIEVEIIQPPESGPLPLVAAGQAEFGISFQEELGPALALEAPLPVTAVAGIIAHNTSGILSMKESAILRPRDLEGKRLVAWDTPLVAGIIKDLVEADGGDFSKVEMVFNNVSDVVTALNTDVDAVWVYYAWDGVAAEVAGLETNFMPIAEYSPVLDYYTPVIVVNDTYAKQNPEHVKAFLAATSRGYQYAMEHPAESAEKFVEIVPELSMEIMLAGQKYLAGQYQADALRWGEIDGRRWSAFYAWMYEHKIIEQPLGDKGFTNDYLPD